MKKVSIIICGLYVALSFIFYSSPVIAEEKYGVVDYQEIITKCNAGKKNIEILKKMENDKHKSLKAKDAELRKLKEDLDRKKTVLSQAAFQEKEMDLQRKARDLQIKAKDSADEMKAKEQEMLNKLLPEVQKRVSAIGEKGKYTMIVDAHIPLYFGEHINLTQKVIEDLNKTYKPKK
jgi:outer membrane protein